MKPGDFGILTGTVFCFLCNLQNLHQRFENESNCLREHVAQRDFDDWLRAGRKLPELRNTKVVTVGELIDDALEFVAHHNDNRNYKGKAVIVREDLGSRHAAEVTPQDLERCLREHCNTAATSNRYKAFISLCYREGARNRKVSVNSARLVR
jgi:hypothetical protein